MRTNLLGIATATLILVCSATAFAKPKIEIAIASTKDVVSTANGKRTVKTVPAKTALPGEVITYTVTYANKGTEAATNAVIDDPIPPGTAYIANSAEGAGSEISFSNDGGRTYAPPVKLFYDYKLPNAKIEKRVATPDHYTHIRWTVAQVPAGASGKLTFKVKVK